MNQRSKPYDYVLITPARNEEDFIESTIVAVISQTILPRKWVVVSDGSTDATDEIVRNYQDSYPWIELVRLPEHRERNFAAKVQAFDAGYRRARDMEYDVVGNLDADITFEKDYFEFLMNMFARDPELGVGGTPFVEGDFQYDYRFTNIDHVSGACQLFRRRCFEEIGGYQPNKAGGIDWVAVTTARMMGWKTRTFTEKTCFHHRPIGTAGSSGLKVRFKQGYKDYFLGGHPLWQLFRAAYQMRSKPYITGGCTLYFGYLWAFASGTKRTVSEELIAFNRAEQMSRLRKMLSRVFPVGGS